MKKSRILIALIVIVSLLPVFPVFADDTASETVQVNTTDAYKKLLTFGVITETEPVLFAENVTRAQLVKGVMKSGFPYALDPAYVTSNNPFADVTESTDGAVEIVTAYSMGIISGGDAFRPDALITKNEAAKILVSVLGYGEISEQKGGYPAGYIAVANELDIFDGCSFTAEGYIKPYDFLVALVNTLETDVLKIGSIHQGEEGWSTVYTNRKKTTLLEKTFGIYKEEGIVESNKYTSINGRTEIKNNRVEIGGAVYEKGATDADELLGYNVEAYYTLDNTETIKTLVYVSAYNNNVLTVEDVDIARDYVDETTFAYYKDGVIKRQKEEIDVSASLIYNGGHTFITAGKLCPTNGFVTLIDNNEDEVFDVIRVTNYSTFKVESVSTGSYKVKDAFTGAVLELNPAAAEYDVKIEVDGKPGAFGDIAVNNIISYTETTGNAVNIKNLKVSTKTVDGFVSQKTDDSIVVEDVEYSVATELSEDITLNDRYTFYLDFRGNVVAYKIGKDVVYGYLNNVASASALANIVKVQIFTENSRWVELRLNDKILYNGTMQPASEFYEDWVNGVVNKELITYTVDSYNNVNMITLAQQFVPYSDEEGDAIANGVFRKYDEYAEIIYRSGSAASFANEFFVNGQTKVFMIPEDGDKDEFTIWTGSNFSSDKTYYNVTPYDLSSGRIAKAIVMPSTDSNKGGISNSTSFMVIESIIKSMNFNDMPVDAINGYYKGSLFAIPVLDSSVYSDAGVIAEDGSIDLAKGDLVLVKMDVNGNIIKLKKVYDFGSTTASDRFFVKNTSNTAITTSAAAWNPTMTYVGGEIYSASEAEKKVVLEAFLNEDGSKGKLLATTDANTAINVYDVELGELIKGSFADLAKGTRFVARIGRFKVSEIIVYINE